MTRIVVAIAIAGIFGGASEAATIISCSGVATSSNSCYTSNLPSFTTQLDWAAFGTPNGAIHTGIWTVNNVSGMDISVSTQNASGARVADNFDSVLKNGTWTMAGFGSPSPYGFAGHFDAPPDTAATSAIAPGSPYGDHLMGLVTNGMSASGTLVISFSQTLTDLAFRIASTTNPTFDARMQLFTGVGGTGTLISDTTFSGLGGGGTCAGLSALVSNPPVPCNDARLIGSVQNADVIRSIVLSTNDVSGFYIGNVFAAENPEPTPFILCGCGMLLLLAGKKKWRRS